MIKLAVVTGLFIAGGYWFLMSSVMNLAMGQTQQFTRQYQQAVQMADQIAAGSSNTAQ